MLTVLLAFAVSVPQTYLIPTPQSVVVKTGSFKLGAHVPLVVDHKSDDEDSFAAEGLIEESPTSFSWGRARFNQPQVLVGRIGRDPATDSKLNKLGLKLPQSAGQDAYILSVRPKQIICAGNSAAGTFYAVQTLKQLIRANKSGETIPSVDIVDWPALEIRGWQDDVSRGPIPTLDFLKKQVKELSEYKLNAFTLYTEHIFKLKKHPTIAPKDGISAEEIIELDKFCKKHHVQLIGNFQSFGHFANILSVPGYENLAETSNVITPAKEESYKFLKDVYSEIAPSYSSPLFNINCDETYGLGDGPAKEMIANEGLGNVYAKHINRVSSLLKAKGKTPMMWGDIALQYPDIRKNLPKDLIVLTWGYDPRASFVDQIEPFTKIGFKFLVCPGVSCWGQNFPDLESATTNISNFVRDGAAHGALGMLNTTWDDTGENLFNNNWYPLVWGAEVAWNSPGPQASSLQVNESVRLNRLASFNQAFPRLFYGLPDGSLSKAFWKLSDMRKDAISGGHSDQAFWKLPWQTDASALASAGNLAQRIMDVQMAIQHAKAKAKRNAESLAAAEVAVDKMAYLYAQAAAMNQLASLMKQSAEVRGLLVTETAESLEGQLVRITNEYTKAWRLENRPWWLDRNLAKYKNATANAARLPLLPLFDPPAGPLTKPTRFQFRPVSNGNDIHYTIDGSEPTISSPKYDGAFELASSTWIKAVAFFKDGRSSPVMSGLYTMLTRPAKIETTWTNYGENTTDKAFDGLLETFFWSYGSVAKDSTFTVTFDDPDMIGGIKITTGHPDHSDDYLKEGVLEVSIDGEKWREMAKFDKGVAECGMIGFRVKAIRIKVGKENGNWLVIREIELK